jgi:DNA modification methylase
MEYNKIIQGDCLDVLKTLPSESVDCVVTSPPYWALRDYGVEGQLGLEPTFQEYITKLCDIFDEVKRVLKKSGTCWVNMGDTYFGSGKGAGGDIENSKQVWSFKDKETRICQHCGKEFTGWKFQNFCGAACSGVDNTPRTEKGKMSDKSLCQIPSRFAIEMSNRGWILRNEIIWHKPNCMPSSVKDRFTVDFEKVFFFVKSKKYWFETQYEPAIDQERLKRRPLNMDNDRKWDRDTEPSNVNTINKKTLEKSWEHIKEFGRNKRCVWTITTKPFKEAHFATYPEKLIEPMIQAGCPVGGVVLDPFIGSGTTGLVAKKQNKNYIGIELNPVYIAMAEKRIKELPVELFKKYV